MDGKSTFGFTMHYHGGPISWMSKKSPHAGTHVGQNETAAQCFAGKHSAHMKCVFEEVQQREHEPAMLLGDNDTTTLFSQEEMITSGNKHYHLPCHWIREVEVKLVKTGRVSAPNNCSDVMIKANDEPTVAHLQPRLCGHTGVNRHPFEFDVKKAKHLPET